MHYVFIVSSMTCIDDDDDDGDPILSTSFLWYRYDLAVQLEDFSSLVYASQTFLRRQNNTQRALNTH